MSSDQVPPVERLLHDAPVIGNSQISGHSRIVVSMRGSSIVIAVSGEQDSANAAELLATCASAVARQGYDLVVDLSAVEFMSAATVNVIVLIFQLMSAQSRSLVVESPSRFARRVLDLCDLSFIISDGNGSKPNAVAPLVRTNRGAALATWVEVPALRPDSPTHHVSIERDETVPSNNPLPLSNRDGT